MQRKLLFLILAVVLAFAYTAVAQDHTYIGVKKCSMCHKGEKKGNMYEIWEASKHAKAFETLGTDASQKVYADLGKSGDPQQDPECLKCHITGADASAEARADLSNENGITCEACHGAGSDYYKMSIMKDREASIANGMVPNPKEHCVDCHNEESPTYIPFNLEERWEQIKHQIPE
ncbi:cytochrome C554 [bacterium]|nr:cytochrome C554 [bacterium]